MKIYLASDHAGYWLKEKIAAFLKKKGYEFEDLGPHSYVKTDDYPDFMHPLAEKVAADPDNVRGIIMGGTGQGEAIVANRHKGVRAAVYYGGSEEVIKLSREHNNANVLSLAGFLLREADALLAVDLWLKTPFSRAERHVRRIAKIDPA